MLTKEEIIGKIEENKETIKGFGVKKLVLFGSYARNESNKDSDIDFLVEFEEGRGLFDDFIHLVHFLEDLLGKRIDLGEEHLLKEELKPYILEGEKIEAKI
ncbi:MAG: nucleotidyltransferase domain-containing protein [Nanoarchaeota archaeon]